MRKTGSRNSHRLRSMFRLCVCLVVACILAVAGSMLSLTRPAHATNIMDTQIPGAQQCEYYSFKFSTSFPALKYNYFRFYFTPLTCPVQGMDWDTNTGTISGTPGPLSTTGSPYTFTVQLVEYKQDGSVYATASPKQFTLSVGPCTVLTFVQTLIPPAKEGALYEATLSATGGSGTYTWTASGLPPGLSLSNNGVISGTPQIGSAGSYAVTVTVNDACCNQSKQGSFIMNVVLGSYEFLVSIGPGLPSDTTTEVYVDGQMKTSLRGGESQKFEATRGTTHVVTVESPIAGQAGEQFVVKDPDEKMVSQDSPSAYFNFVPAVFIEFNTDPPGITSLQGTDWYAVGAKVQSTAPAAVESSEPGEEFRFAYWMVPPSDKIQADTVQLTASEATEIKAFYDTYFELTVVSPYGEETSNWYKAGEEAEWSLQTTEVRGSGVCGAFGGKVKAVETGGTVVMDGAKTITTEWLPDNTVPAIIFSVFGLLVVGGGGFFAYSTVRRRQAPKAEAPSRKPKQPPTTKAKATPKAVKAKAQSGRKKPPQKAKSASKSNFCPNCGDPLAPGENFCDKCGKKVR